MKYIDKWLALSVITLLALGFTIVLSASIPIADKLEVNSFHFAVNQLFYITIGLICLFVISHVPIDFLQEHHFKFLLFSIFLLIFLLLPGVSRPVNGSLRWIFIGPISIQPSEMAKVSFIIYIASYMVRRSHAVLFTLRGFLIPMSVLTLLALLLLLEPDFGTVVVLAITTLGMLFLGGVQARRFLILLPFIFSMLIYFALSSSYRVQRIISFRDPWADQFNSGYQLVQSLIAFGRGSWLGTGLGSSVQKLLYLPEAHTDFIYAILAEELGLVGAVFVILLYGIIIFKSLDIAQKAHNLKMQFAGNLAYGVGLLLVIQAIINISVNMGLLPTKGLTLPLMSAGGSSMIMACILVGILFRVDFEVKTYTEVGKD